MKTPLVEFTEVLVEHHNSESRENINAAVIDRTAPPARRRKLLHAIAP